MKTINLETAAGRKMVLKTDDVIKNRHELNNKFLSIIWETAMDKKLSYRLGKYSDIIDLMNLMKCVVPKKYRAFFLELITSYTGEIIMKELKIGEWCVDESGQPMLFLENGYDLSRFWDVKEHVAMVWNSVRTGKKTEVEDIAVTDYVKILGITE